MLAINGPAEIIRRVRDAEAQISGTLDAAIPDDATVASATSIR